MTKTAMIWGAHGGIGQELVRQLVAQAWQVIAISRHAEKIEQLTPLSFAGDVSNAYEVQNAVTAASHEVTEVNLWVYAAGDITAVPIKNMALDQWQRILNNNLTGAFLTTRYSLPLLAPDAHLFYLGAISERLHLPGLAAYAAAKAGLEAFTDTLRKEERRRKVTIIRPGAVATPLWDKVPMNLPKNAASPAKVAAKIIEAYQQEEKGQLDLT